MRIKAKNNIFKHGKKTKLNMLLKTNNMKDKETEAASPTVCKDTSQDFSTQKWMQDYRQHKVLKDSE